MTEYETNVGPLVTWERSTFYCVVCHNAHCCCSVEEAATDSIRSYETAILDQDSCATFISARFSSQQVCRFYCAIPLLIAGSIKHLTFTYSTALLGAVVTLHQLVFKLYLLQILPALPGILTNFFMLLYHLSEQILVHYFLICQYHQLLEFSTCEHFSTHSALYNHCSWKCTWIT